MQSIRELVVDAYGCQADLSDYKEIEKYARAAAAKVGATVAEVVCHRFQPHGITLCLILKESHLIISTWPEHRLAVINVFLCNPSMEARQCWDVLSGYLKPDEVLLHEVPHQIAARPARKAAA